MFSIILLAATLSISGSETISNLKYISILFVFLMMVLSVLFFRTFILLKRRKLYKKLNNVLIGCFYESKFIIPLVEFADKGRVDISTAQNFIETLIKPFNNKIDINQDGLIIYKYEISEFHHEHEKISRKKRK